MAIASGDIRATRQVSAWRSAASRLQGQGALFALVLAFLVGWLRYGDNGFTSTYNITSVLRFNAMFALLALGLTFVIITGGIDLSVSGVAAMTSVVAAMWSEHGVWLATLGAIAVGVGVGLLNGGIIAGFGIQPFVVTLATLLAARGTALYLADDSRVTVSFDSDFLELDLPLRDLFGFGGWIGEIPMPVIVAALAYLAGSLVLNLTRFGRHVLALGGNEEAARLAGLPIARTTLAVYALSGGLAGLTGAILAAQTFTGNPTEALGWELQAIAAVVVGGTLLTGGVGSVGTTLVGVLLLGLIFNLLNFEGLGPYWQTIARGLFLLAVVVLQSRLARRQFAVTTG